MNFQRLRFRNIVLLTVACSSGLLGAAERPQFTAPSGSTVYQTGNFTLTQGSTMSVGAMSLIMQTDGNLVLYQQDGTVVWSTGTGGQDCSGGQCVAIFQTDGNFVVYNGGTPLWSSGTSGHPDAQLILSPRSPQLEIITGDDSVLWATTTSFSAGTFQLGQGASFGFGSLTLSMQTDGNLVLYSPSGTPLWYTATSGQDCSGDQCVAVFQTDGNLVVYNGSTPLWTSATGGHPGAQLLLYSEAPELEIVDESNNLLFSNEPLYAAGTFQLAQNTYVAVGSSTLLMQTDGNLVLYSSDGTPLWSTGTGGQDCTAGQCVAIFQSDGNFVVYNGSTVLWTSGTAGYPDAELLLDGQSPQLEITNTDSSILWANVDTFDAGNLTLYQGTSVDFDSLSLTMQTDGNLVLYQSDGSVVWTTGTSGQDCSASQCVAIFQFDGNFVVYNGSTALWTSGTGGNPGAQLVLSPTSPEVQIVGSGAVLYSDARGSQHPRPQRGVGSLSARGPFQGYTKLEKMHRRNTRAQ
jgi:hypothetical protein